METLPKDIILTIFNYLDIFDLLNISKINKLFYYYINNNKWNVKNIKINRFNEKRIQEILTRFYSLNIWFDNLAGMDHTFEFIKKCQNITISNIRITRNIIMQLNNLNIKSLCLKSCDISNIYVFQSLKIPDLKKFIINFYISNSVLFSIIDINSSIEHLELNYDSSNNALYYINTENNIKYLKIQAEYISDYEIKFLNKWVNLESLDIIVNNNYINISEINLPKLKHFNIIKKSNLNF